MLVYTHYAIGTGQITETVSCNHLSQLDSAAGTAFLSGAHSDVTHYVAGGVAVPRPVMSPVLGDSPPADGTTAILLSGLPLDAIDPVVVTYRGPGFETGGVMDAGDSDCTFIADTPGQYSIRVQAFPYLDWEGSFEAV